MCGRATLAIVVSSICMTIAPMTPIVTSHRCLTWSIGWPGTGSAMVRLCVDLHLGAETGDQRTRRSAVNRDAHRHALSHLDPVAIGVLRRKHRELRSGARTNA